MITDIRIEKTRLGCCEACGRELINSPKGANYVRCCKRLYVAPEYSIIYTDHKGWIHVEGYDAINCRYFRNLLDSGEWKNHLLRAIKELRHAGLFRMAVLKNGNLRVLSYAKANLTDMQYNLLFRDLRRARHAEANGNWLKPCK